MNTTVIEVQTSTHDQSRFQFWALVGATSLLTVLSAVPAAAAASVAGIVLMLRYGLGYANGVVRLAWPLSAVFVLGLLHAGQNIPKDVVRDMLFAFNPLALLFAGYFLSSRVANNGRLIDVIVFSGLISAALHLSAFVFNPGLLFEDAQEIRNQAGSGESIVAVAFVLLLHGKRLPYFYPWRSNPRQFYPALVLLLMSLILSFSRTDFVTVILLMLALSGYIGRLKWRNILRIALVLATSGVLVYIFGEELQADRGFLAKIGRSFTEVTLADYTSAEDINNNWRGFEAFQAFSGFLNAGPLEQFVGRGFGALVDLGFYMNLGGVEFRYIPWLHNGYAYILTKFGVLGIFLYGYFYLSLIRIGMRYAHHNEAAVRFFSRTLAGTIVSLAAITLVVGGIPGGAAGALVMLVGYSAGMLRRALGLGRCPL
ncbi:hypothetical protein [Massilia varians]|uniref:hypothetical protein n=1 Tax=Massilia varians TaxID=457921 RepID=UPI0025564227|nr:hypothetical protein [Massilia varians]MDK6079269.1 hypothetical protein [Massilia varians]